MSRTITFNIQVKIPIGLYYISGGVASDAVRQALSQGGFIVNNINVISESVAQWFYLVAVVQAVEDSASIEGLRQYAQNLISNHKSSIDYGLFNGSYYNTFEAVEIQVINESSIPKSINYNNIGQGGILANLTESLGLGKQTGDNISQDISKGLQFSTPILLGAGLLFLLLYLKK